LSGLGILKTEFTFQQLFFESGNVHFCAAEMEDTYRHQGLRRQLVEVVRKKGITDERVLKAIMAVPRHLYMDNAFLHFAYDDTAFPIGAGQTISQPYTVAFQSQLLGLKPRDKVLEIGTGSGYQSAVLCEMGVKVFTVERQRELYEKSALLLKKLGYKAKVFYGDGYKGLPAFAPFDAILVTCGAPFIPEDLIKQLKPGGKLVIPVGEGAAQKMKRLTKLTDGSVEVEEFGEFRFVPMLKNRQS